MRHYMRITTQFVRSINLFPVPNQIVEEDDTIFDERFNAMANFLLSLIDQDEEEVTNLDIVTHLVENWTRQWVDAQISQLKVQGVVLTYGELEDELKSETDSGAIATPIEEAPKFPATMRSKKRKDAPECHLKHKVYTRKATKGESSKKARKIGGFVSEMPTIEEDPQHEGEEESKRP